LSKKGNIKERKNLIGGGEINARGLRAIGGACVLVRKRYATAHEGSCPKWQHQDGTSVRIAEGSWAEKTSQKGGRSFIQGLGRKSSLKPYPLEGPGHNGEKKRMDKQIGKERHISFARKRVPLGGPLANRRSMGRRGEAGNQKGLRKGAWIFRGRISRG